MLRLIQSFRSLGVRHYKVLSIETSCDDTCVAILDRFDRNQAPKLLYNHSERLNSAEDGGIVPTKAHNHHQKNLAIIVKQALACTGSSIDLLCVTKGPGMRGALAVGLDFTKGLSVAWNKPLVGVHHMLGHLLLPRMESNGRHPQFPFLSLLVSGGHTMLVLTKSIVEHEILCDTIDIAVGDSLDKCAREIGIRGDMIAKEMERIIDQDIQQATSDQGVKIELPVPLRNQNGRMNMQAFSFSPFISAVKSNMPKPQEELSDNERRSMAYQIQEAIFSHVIRQLNVVLKFNGEALSGVKSFVCSGGVSANKRLRERLETELTKSFSFHYPDLELCTDNAVMIGWAGIELYENHNLATDLRVVPCRKWPLTNILDDPWWLKDSSNDR
ncbi:HCL106Wp [Eremothecium sinecaudum]|uniref:N(6)-L-threonylcarbamoyladenine synthase n=1 Tax=Eremothecium sinecaudum TaxID=45286 RepID=A0A0X8HRE1_9SACH|nr:HCL106Wp [Eremothecium sinecaudum]AMD20045.1 HCL106Wp [Eremothecium sinecaudum]